MLFIYCKTEIADLKLELNKCQISLAECELQLQKQNEIIVTKPSETIGTRPSVFIGTRLNEIVTKNIPKSTGPLCNANQVNEKSGGETQNTNIVIKGLKIPTNTKPEETVKELLSFMNVHVTPTYVKLLKVSGHILVGCESQRQKSLIFRNCHLLKDYPQKISIRDELMSKSRSNKQRRNRNNESNVTRQLQSKDVIKNHRDRPDNHSLKNNQIVTKPSENKVIVTKPSQLPVSMSIVSRDDSEDEPSCYECTGSDSISDSWESSEGVVEYFRQEDFVQEEVNDLIASLESWGKDDEVVCKFMSLISESRDMHATGKNCMCNEILDTEKALQFLELHNVSEDLCSEFAEKYNIVMCNLEQHWTDYYDKALSSCFCVNVAIPDLLKHTNKGTTSTAPCRFPSE
ncbi:hypothetical protein Fcan01_15510 [Folsomia candida]|uniref:Uncharacterized protein n=1 Tax=Folsomia candida TaxID=158441 RepID=A0A226DWL2_FOLCA|nr:hypothetical protein Fcan01_15510 [Folsomia candida]